MHGMPGASVWQRGKQQSEEQCQNVHLSEDDPIVQQNLPGR
jgi:hypothetical protein